MPPPPPDESPETTANPRRVNQAHAYLATKQVRSLLEWMTQELVAAQPDEPLALLQEVIESRRRRGKKDVRRIRVAPNGIYGEEVELEVPEHLSELITQAGEALSLQGSILFHSGGTRVRHARDLEDGAMIYLSTGEEFAAPAPRALLNEIEQLQVDLAKEHDEREKMEQTHTTVMKEVEELNARLHHEIEKKEELAGELSATKAELEEAMERLDQLAPEETSSSVGLAEDDEITANGGGGLSARKANENSSSPREEMEESGQGTIEGNEIEANAEAEAEPASEAPLPSEEPESTPEAKSEAEPTPESELEPTPTSDPASNSPKEVEEAV